MHLGNLKNKDFIESYNELGFSTKTQLIDAACDELKRKLAKGQCARWCREGHKEYAQSGQEFVWKDIDDEDFEEH